MGSNCPPITVTKEERGRSGTTTVVSQDDDADPIPVGSKRTLQRPIPLPRFTPRTVLFICLYLFFFFLSHCALLPAARRLHSKHNIIANLLSFGNSSAVPRFSSSLLAPTTVDLVDLLEVPAQPCCVCCG